MITAQKFSANLRAFSKLDETARALFAETVEYVNHQWHKHGNKTPFNQLIAAAPRGVFGDMIKKLKLGTRDRQATDADIARFADMTTATLFADQKQKKEINAAKRTVAKRVASTGNTQKVEAEFVLASAESIMELNEAEFRAAMNLVMAMRSEAVETVPMLKAA
jgi:uncharacterized UPF0160 family protein